MFGFEYAILMTIVANTVVKYVLHSVDLYSEAPWENKAVFMLYTELFIGLIKVFLTELRIRIRIWCFFDPWDPGRDGEKILIRDEHPKSFFRKLRGRF